MHTLCAPLIFSLIAALLVHAHGHARTNIVPEGQSVVLMSSKERAQFSWDSDDPDTKAQKRAAWLCQHIGKKMVEVTVHEFSETELNSLAQERIYQSNIFDDKSEGTSFKHGTYALERYPLPVPVVEQVEMIGYGGALIVFVGGGFSTGILAIGFEGGAEPMTTMIFGCVTAGVSLLCTLVGGAATLFRKYRTRPPEALLDEETPKPVQAIYALPILADQIWCE